MSDILLDLSQVRVARSRVDRIFAAPALPASDADVFRVQADVHLSFELFKDGAQFRLVGRVQSTLELACGRCLDEIALPVDLPFDLLYLPHQEHLGVDGEDVQVEDDDLTTAYYRDDQIDLGELALEQFYLALPMKPLCRESCRGLCLQCGTNLNTATCSCVFEWTDPRLDSLRSLLDKDDHEA